MKKSFDRIPKALIIVKENSGLNWPRIKKCFIDYLNCKRDIYKSNLAIRNQKYIERLIYKDICIKIGNIKFDKCDIGWENFLSHSLNCITAFYRREYDSLILCYIQDSFCNIKSGNKKYPQLNLEKICVSENKL